MSETVLLVIVSGLIGFIPSALVALIVHILHLGEKRKETQRTVVENRLNQIEKYATEMIRMIQLSYMYSLGLSKSEERDNQTIEIIQNMVIFRSTTYPLRDKKMTEFVDNFFLNFKIF